MMRNEMSIKAIVGAVLESGRITRDQEEQINHLLRQDRCTEADLYALDTLCAALFSGKVESVASAKHMTHAA